MKNTRSGALTALVLVTLGAMACTGCKTTQASEQPSPPPGEIWLSPQAVEDSKIALSPVGEHEIGGVIRTSGKMSFDDLHVSHVFSPVEGRVTKILAQLGQRVKKGDALAVIESPEIGIAATPISRRGFADTVAAEHDYKRQKDLFAAGAAPQKDFEAAEDNFRKAKAELERSRQRARLLRTGATGDPGGSGFVLRSLIDGEVTSRTVNPGMEVQGQYTGGGAVELFTIGEVDPILVLADAYEMDLPRVKVGEKATVKLVSYPDRLFEWHGRLGRRLARSAVAHRQGPLHHPQPRSRAQAGDVRDGRDPCARPQRALAPAKRRAPPGRPDGGLREGRRRAGGQGPVRAPTGHRR